VLCGGRIRNSGVKCCFKHIATTSPRTDSESLCFSNSSVPVSQITVLVTYLAYVSVPCLLFTFQNVFQCCTTSKKATRWVSVIVCPPYKFLGDYALV